MSANVNQNTLRLLFPQWQGGNNAPYFFGAQLLNWLAPKAYGPEEEVVVEAPAGQELVEEDGIKGRNALVKQLEDAFSKINKHQPERIVVLGGDCLVDLAPFAYLSEKYGDELAVLWVDAHPDILTPEQFNHGHAMVLGSLMGNGDKQFASYVKRPIHARQVCYLGVNQAGKWEQEQMQQLGLHNVSPEQLREHGSSTLTDWFASTGAKYLAIHLDLDVLDPALFRALLFANTAYPDGTFDGIAQGKLSIAEVISALVDMSKVADVVGLGIAEHLPWDALALKQMLEQLPLIGNQG